jgi:RNA polymerase sigma-70 factor (ECF subfamily)
MLYRVVSAGFLGPSIAWLARRDELMDSPFILLRENQDTSEGHLVQRKEIVELYDRLRPSLYQYLICIGCKPQDADDVIQEAFLRLFRQQRDGGAVDNPRSWLFRVAQNLSFDVHRKERRFVSDGNEEVAGATFQRHDPSLNPEELFLHKEQLLRLDVAIAQLPERQRQLLHLRAEGLRYREIAEVLAMTVSGVNETLRRVVMRIVEQLYE